MKINKTIFYILMFLPLLAVIVALQFLPDQIPAHYNIENQVDRWGSKYETLIFPVFVIVFGAFMLGMSKLAAKREMDGNNNERVYIIIGIVTLIMFDAMTGFFLYTAFNQIENLSSTPFDLYQLTAGILGISMIIMGNIMPKLRMNAFIGIRTSRSMKNEVLWKKSQRFGGICFIVGGAVMVIVSLCTKEVICGIISLADIIIVAIVSAVYTYKVEE